MGVVVCHFCHFCNTNLASGHRRECTRDTRSVKIFFAKLAAPQSTKLTVNDYWTRQTTGDDLSRDQGRGLHPRKSSRTPPQEVNGRGSYFLHEGGDLYNRLPICFCLLHWYRQARHQELEPQAKNRRAYCKKLQVLNN